MCCLHLGLVCDREIGQAGPDYEREHILDGLRLGLGLKGGAKGGTGQGVGVKYWLREHICENTIIQPACLNAVYKQEGGRRRSV